MWCPWVMSHDSWDAVSNSNKRCWIPLYLLYNSTQNSWTGHRSDSESGTSTWHRRSTRIEQKNWNKVAGRKVVWELNRCPTIQNGDPAADQTMVAGSQVAKSQQSINQRESFQAEKVGNTEEGEKTKETRTHIGLITMMVVVTVVVGLVPVDMVTMVGFPVRLVTAAVHVSQELVQGLVVVVPPRVALVRRRRRGGRGRHFLILWVSQKRWKRRKGRHQKSYEHSRKDSDFLKRAHELLFVAEHASVCLLKGRLWGSGVRAVSVSGGLRGGTRTNCRVVCRTNADGDESGYGTHARKTSDTLVTFLAFFVEAIVRVCDCVRKSETDVNTVNERWAPEVWGKISFKGDHGHDKGTRVLCFTEKIDEIWNRGFAMKTERDRDVLKLTWVICGQMIAVQPRKHYFWILKRQSALTEVHRPRFVKRDVWIFKLAIWQLTRNVIENPLLS